MPNHCNDLANDCTILLIFWEKNITEIHVKNLNNSPPKKKVDKKDEDIQVIGIKTDSLSNFNHFDGLLHTFNPVFNVILPVNNYRIFLLHHVMILNMLNYPSNCSSFNNKSVCDLNNCLSSHLFSSLFGLDTFSNFSSQKSSKIWSKNLVKKSSKKWRNRTRFWTFFIKISLKFFDQIIEDFLLKNLNNLPPPENDENKDEDIEFPTL